MDQHFFKNLFTLLLDKIQQGTILAYQKIWDGITSYLLGHLIVVIIILFVVFLYSLVRGLMGHWWIFGSVAYNYLYFGSLLVIGSIWGPEIFSNTYADIGFFLLYILCYIGVGMILSKAGIRRR